MNPIFTNPQDKVRHDRMVSLVEKMLALHKQLQSRKRGGSRLDSTSDRYDGSVDQLVYELYGLTQKEVEIVKRER